MAPVSSCTHQGETFRNPIGGNRGPGRDISFCEGRIFCFSAFCNGRSSFDPLKYCCPATQPSNLKNRTFNHFSLQNQYTYPPIDVLLSGITYIALGSTIFTTRATAWLSGRLDFLSFFILLGPIPPIILPPPSLSLPLPLLALYPMAYAYAFALQCVRMCPDRARLRRRLCLLSFQPSSTPHGKIRSPPPPLSSTTTISRFLPIRPP